jgi:hypothetical protein
LRSIKAGRSKKLSSKTTLRRIKLAAMKQIRKRVELYQDSKHIKALALHEVKQSLNFDEEDDEKMELNDDQKENIH